MDQNVKICWLIFKQKYKSTTGWSLYKRNPIEFNKLCYTENDTGTFQRVDEVLQGIIEIRKKETKFQEMYQIIFRHIFIRIILLKTYCVISISENISLQRQLKCKNKSQNFPNVLIYQGILGYAKLAIPFSTSFDG